MDLKRPSTALKKLKCIRGELKLDISVAQERIKHCFTPELTKIIPFPGTDLEILAFFRLNEN